MTNSLSLSDLLLVPYVRQVGFAVRYPWKIGPRRIMDYLLIYVQEGQLITTVDHVEYECMEKEFCLIQPGSLLMLEGKTKTITPFAHLDFFYNPLREQSFITKTGQTDLSTHMHLMQPRINDIEHIHIPVKFVPMQPVLFRDQLLKLIDIWERHGPFYELQSQHIATSLFLDLAHVFMDKTQVPTPPEQMLNWVTSYINFNLSEPISVADMAKRAMLSPSRFTAVFRESFGISPHQYLLRSRVQHAELLLRSGSLTLQEIADFCGFANIHHFSRVYKEKTGYSPGEFRKQVLH